MENEEWEDITESFFAAASALGAEELVHDDKFGLFEAMSAIEMMDTKMDAGMLCHKVHAMGFEEAVQSNKLKLNKLTLEENIGIIDATVACLCTWLEGNSLAQTLFSNLYTHRPQEIMDRPMKAAIVGLLKITDAIREISSKAGVYEEEDFQSMVYGFQLCNNITPSRAVGMFKEVEEELYRNVKSIRSKGNISPEQEKEIAKTSALLERIVFLRLFLQILNALQKKDVTAGVGEAKKLLKQCRNILRSIEDTVNLGLQPELVEDGSGSQSYKMMAIEPLVNQRLLPPTFPRYTVIKTRAGAYSDLMNLLNRIQMATLVLQDVNFHVVLEFFTEFSKQNPCVLSRSLLQLIYMPQQKLAMGNQTFLEIIRDGMKTFICPPSIVCRSLASNLQTKDCIDQFMSHALQQMLMILKIAGHNRARQREKYASILEDLSNLQQEAEKVDCILHAFSLKLDPPRIHLACYGTWVVHHIVRTMIQYVQLGLELELYASYEYPYVFWYLHEFLYTWLLTTLDRAHAFLQEQDNITETLKSAKKKNKKKKLKTRPYTCEYVIAQAHHALCGGYFKAVIAFLMTGKLKEPQVGKEFSSEQIRYEHRFQPFSAVVTPPPIHYAQFCDMLNMMNGSCGHVSQPVELYTTAMNLFSRARTLFDSVQNASEEVLNLRRVCKTNFVVMKLMAGGHECAAMPTYDFSAHKSFPIIKI